MGEKRQNTKAGVTLIETLLYISIATTILVATSGFLATMLQMRIKTHAIQEVHEQGGRAMHQILQTIRNAESIIAPSEGTAQSSLRLDVVTPAQDPTVFSISGDALHITEGSDFAQLLTNSRIRITSFTAENLSRPGTPGIIRVQFTIEHINPSGRNEYAFQETFTGSASVRQP